MGIIFVAPWLLAALWARGRLALLLAPSVLILLPGLVEVSGGWAQFGYRYRLDALPFTAALAAIALIRAPRRLVVGLACYRGAGQRLGRGLAGVVPGWRLARLWYPARRDVCDPAAEDFHRSAEQVVICPNRYRGGAGPAGVARSAAPGRGRAPRQEVRVDAELEAEGPPIHLAEGALQRLAMGRLLDPVAVQRVAEGDGELVAVESHWGRRH